MEKYDEHLEEVLKKQLTTALEDSKKTTALLEECRKLKSELEFLETNNFKELDTSYNLGCDVFVKAHVPNAKKIIIDIGCQHFMEMERKDGIKFLEKKIQFIEFKLQKQVERVIQIKADTHHFLHLYSMLLENQSGIRLNEERIPQEW